MASTTTEILVVMRLLIWVRYSVLSEGYGTEKSGRSLIGATMWTFRWTRELLNYGQFMLKVWWPYIHSWHLVNLYSPFGHNHAAPSLMSMPPMLRPLPPPQNAIYQHPTRWFSTHSPSSTPPSYLNFRHYHHPRRLRHVTRNLSKSIMVHLHSFPSPYQPPITSQHKRPRLRVSRTLA